MHADLMGCDAERTHKIARGDSRQKEYVSIRQSAFICASSLYYRVAQDKDGRGLDLQ